MQGRLPEAVLNNPFPAKMRSLTNLQRASRAGLWSVVIDLLNLGANVDQVSEDVEIDKLKPYDIRQAKKTPLYLAVENGHSLVAQVLLAMGADIDIAMNIANNLNDLTMENRLQNLELDPNTTFNLAFYTINHFKDNTLLPQLLGKLDKDYSNIDAVSALTEFVFCFYINTRAETAKVLLERLNGRLLRNVPGVFTAGYWAALHNKDLLKQTCSTNKEWLTTLCQLKATNMTAPLGGCMRAVPSSVKKEFLAIKQFEIRVDYADLTPEQNAAYADLAAGENSIELYCESVEDYKKIFEVAYKNKNLIVLSGLHDALNEKNLMQVFLENSDYAINQFLFFGSNLGFLEWALSSEDTPAILSKVTKNFVTEEGLLYSLMSVSMSLSELPLPAAVRIVNAIKPDKDTLTLVLQRCVQDYHSIAAVTIEREESKEEQEYKRNPFLSMLALPPALSETPSQHKINVLLTDALTPHDFSIVKICFNRFGVGVQQENPFERKSKIPPFKDLAPKVWSDYILPSLDSKTLKALASVSHAMNEYKLQAALHFNETWKANDVNVIEKERRQNALIRFENNGEALDRLTRAVQKAVEEKSFWEGRESALCSLLGLAVYFSLMVLEGYGTYYGSINLASAENNLRKLITHNGRSCYSNAACDLKSWYPECASICDDLDGMFLTVFFSFMGLALQLAFLPMLPEIFDFRAFQGAERFNNLDLKDLSEDVKFELKEAKSAQPDPIPFIHENSRLTFVQFEIKRLREGYQANANRIKAQIAAEAKEEAIRRQHEAEIERLARGEAPKDSPEKKSASKSAKLMAALGHFSPAKAVLGIASLFRAAPAISFEAADRGLLQDDEHNEMKYPDSDSDEDEKADNNGSYQPPRFNNPRSLSFFQHQAPSQASSSKKSMHYDSSTLAVELVSSSTKKKAADIVIDVTPPRGSQSKMR